MNTLIALLMLLGNQVDQDNFSYLTETKINCDIAAAVRKAGGLERVYKRIDGIEFSKKYDQDDIYTVLENLDSRLTVNDCK